MEVSKLMLKYVFYLFGELENTCEKNALNEETLRKLYAFSKKHDLAHLVGDVLDRNGLLAASTEARKCFLQERNMAVYRVEQLQYEFEQICTAFEEEKILFIPLKGSVIRPLYPELWMRTSCDIDILIKENCLDKAIDVLKLKCGYAYSSAGDHDVSLFAPSGVHLELHYHLITPHAKNEENIVLGRVWECLKEDSAVFAAQCEMADDIFYCYHISHIAKHLKCGGCGARSILDTWILNHRMQYNPDKRSALLQQAGLFSVAKAIENLAEVWFSGVEGDSLTESLGEYILTGGVYGTFDNKVAAQQTRKKGKFSYLLSRVFLPYSQMKFKYPRLQKCPILYPFYIVKRCFLLLNKEKRMLALREVDQTINADEKQQKIAKLMKDLDL